ncbi:putative malate dehydrogenase [Clavispora lusitaniae]|uniref:Malate dehydrogenase n=1 Tax=Clavispora lusitaniae TaxID=36911 RepID=A0ACD0WR09_CLALS|nr:hypothetical protein E0198_004432 [Clavispora lusitaniae]QFZ29835.1 putative malate dehydrogenase [Clavispora lusitaniae]QFZ35485.1 putative malate dehydrogenase [Clavispora lusitaniae]QFZ41179.1 putative malate dehydrogenase [Clavispora lusitaniae]QFZ46860.1 putative malate dehydrogenase [Clavispora lusitaniae]
MVKVTVCGAAGGIGQPLSMLLKLNPRVSRLALYDIVNAVGVAADLSHINTPAVVTGHQPAAKNDSSALVEALQDSDIVVIPAGVPRKPGMSRADLFNINASIVRDLVAHAGRTCPNAAILIISNPVNATVAIAAAVLKKLGVFNPRKLFGVTTLDSVRAETFLAQILDVSPASLRGKISVVGGHSGDTIVPLVHFDRALESKMKTVSASDYANFVHRVQYGGDEVVKAKNGAGSATLSMAYAGYRFASNVLASLVDAAEYSAVPDSAYIYLDGAAGGAEIATTLQDTPFFSVPVHLKKGEVSSVVDPWHLVRTHEEKKMIAVALEGLEKSVSQGTNFVEGSKI